MRVLKQHIKKLSKSQFLEIHQMCLHSRALYNSCLYTTNKYFEETGKYIGLVDLYAFIKTNIHYISLPQKISNQILRLVDKNYRSFFSLLKRKRLGQYNDKINFPQYKKKNSEFILILDNQQVNIRKGLIKLTKNLKIPFSFNLKGKLQQAIIKPKGNGYYEIHLAYIEEEEIKPQLNPINLLSIDLGLDNLVSCFSNVGRNFIISGKPLKSYNQFYNKIKANMQSEMSIKNKKKWSNKLNKLSINRDNYINNYLNQTINLIIKECIINKVSKIIIGYNESWKKDINIGNKNNQNFFNIPHYRLKEKLKSKCQSHGIEFILQEESYTSKCSSLDLESIEKHEKYVGKREKRGLFKGSQHYINADINGAINIMRKVVGDDATFAYKSIERCTIHPVVLKATH